MTAAVSTPKSTLGEPKTSSVPDPSEYEPPLPTLMSYDAASKSPEAAKTLIKFLTGPEAASRYKPKGFEPG
jgi:hypothetical protein